MSSRVSGHVHFVSFVSPEALTEQMSSDRVLEEGQEPIAPITGASLPDLPAFAAFHTTAFLLLTGSVAYTPAGVCNQKKSNRLV